MAVSAASGPRFAGIQLKITVPLDTIDCSLILRNCNASPEKLEDALDFTLRLKSRTFSDAGAASGNVLSLTPALRVYTSTLDILGEEVKPSTVSHTSAGVASEKILEHVQNLESFLAAGVLADKLEYGQSSHLEVCLALSNTCQALAQALLPEGIDMGAGSSIASLLSLRVPGLILAQTAGRVSDPAKVSTRLSWLELACRNTRTLPGGAGDSDSKTGISLETVVGVSLVFAQTCDIICRCSCLTRLAAALSDLFGRSLMQFCLCRAGQPIQNSSGCSYASRRSKQRTTTRMP